MSNKSIKIKFLPADEGDCFLIIFNDLDNCNQTVFLIDGGYKTRYKTYVEEPLVRSFGIKDSNNYIVVTHTDEDHIGGIQEFFASKNAKSLCVKSVIFNTTNSLKYLTPEVIDNPPNICIPDNLSTKTSYKSGIALEQKLKELEIPVITNIIAPNKLQIEDVNITFLSPRKETMKKYKSWIELKEKKTKTSKKVNDYKESIEILKSNPFEEDKSITNASSISMLIEYGKRKILLLGDSIPSDIVSSLLELGYSKENKLKLDIVKVSHHGSKRNTCDGFLECIICDNFLISTNGGVHQHPDKECLARIINLQKKPNLIFNYDRYKRIFSPEELASNKFCVLEQREMVLNEE